MVELPLQAFKPALFVRSINRRFFIFLIFGILAGMAVMQFLNGSGKTGSRSHSVAKQQVKTENIPKEVYNVLEYVLTFGVPMEGYTGGREFHNFEKRLPEYTGDHKAIRYREWDIRKRRPGKGRGPERLVTGDDGSAWYTRDHYKTFYKIR